MDSPTTSTAAAPPPAPLARRALRGAWRATRFTVRLALAAVSWGLLAALAAAVAAHVVQDRTAWLAPAAYLPLWVIGVPVLAWDLLRLGRSLPLRWLLACLGLATTLLGVAAMWSPRLPPEPAGENWGTVRLLHWNVKWGGLAGQPALQQIVETLRQQDADVALLSEMAAEHWFWQEWQRAAPPGLTLTTAGMGPGGGYWFRFGVLSRWPATKRAEWPLPNGRAVLFEVDVPRAPGAPPLRILGVDMESSPRSHRAPGLVRVGEIAEELFRAGTPADVIAGDFNAPWRAWGFDRVAAAGTGYRRAALWSGQWRATWPSRFPMFDIDHILTRRGGASVTGSAFFASPASDHRGQTATLRSAGYQVR